MGNSDFGEATNLCERDALPLAWWICSIIWLVGFSVWFFSFAWPLNPSGHRWTALVLAPYDILDLFDPPVIAGALPWSWRNLGQRIPFLLIALLIWVGSWGIGSSFLRLLKADFAGAERLFFACGIGVSIVSLITLANGLFCGLSRSLLIVLLVLPSLVEGFLVGRTLLARSRKLAWSTATINLGLRSSSVSRWGWIVLACVSPFVIGSMLGAMSPQTDFDVVEYHLGGPKEWFQQGRIVRLPHNVYTSFPFLSEMLILSGMVLYGDWQWGALTGQAAIAGFAPLTAVGIYAFGSRWISND